MKKLKSIISLNLVLLLLLTVLPVAVFADTLSVGDTLEYYIDGDYVEHSFTPQWDGLYQFNTNAVEYASEGNLDYTDPGYAEVFYIDAYGDERSPVYTYANAGFIWSLEAGVTYIVRHYKGYYASDDAMYSLSVNDVYMNEIWGTGSASSYVDEYYVAFHPQESGWYYLTADGPSYSGVTVEVLDEYLYNETQYAPYTANGTYGFNIYAYGDETYYICVGLNDPGASSLSVQKVYSPIIKGDRIGNAYEGGFTNCWKLEHIYIPEQVRDIDDGAFFECAMLEDFQVSPDNQYYCAVDDVLYSKDKTVLKNYPAEKQGSSYNVPYGVTDIAYGTFNWNWYLDSVELPTTVKHIAPRAFSFSGIREIALPVGISRIEDCAFLYNTNLSEIYIPSSVTYIGDGAFYECENLTDVYYGGDYSQWCNICFGSDNEYLLNADVHFVSGGLPGSPFADVSEDTVYYYAVKWANNREITTGYGDGTFRPNDACTRAQVVTFLWRAAGCPQPSGYNPFNDVSMYQANGSANPYYKAILWAYENGITTGYGDGGFHPNDTVTRAQFVTFLYRYAGEPGAYVEYIWDFTDAASISTPYQRAVAWAVDWGITTGYSDGTFRPNDPCTRWAVVLFMDRALN